MNSDVENYFNVFFLKKRCFSLLILVLSHRTDVISGFEKNLEKEFFCFFFLSLPLSSSDAKTCPCQLDEVCHQNDREKGERNMAVIISDIFLFASFSKKDLK